MCVLVCMSVRAWVPVCLHARVCACTCVQAHMFAGGTWRDIRGPEPERAAARFHQLLLSLKGAKSSNDLGLMSRSLGLSVGPKSWIHHSQGVLLWVSLHPSWFGLFI